MHVWFKKYGITYVLPQTYNPYTHRLNDLERISLWADGGGDMQWFLSGKKISFKQTNKLEDSCDDSSRLTTVVKLWLEEGKEISYVEADWEHGRALGYHSVKVVVSNMYPMYHDTRNWPEGWMGKDGLDTATPPSPHPFP
jgi:hypothetical protein